MTKDKVAEAIVKAFNCTILNRVSYPDAGDDDISIIKTDKGIISINPVNHESTICSIRSTVDEESYTTYMFVHGEWTVYGEGSNKEVSKESLDHISKVIARCPYKAHYIFNHNGEL